MTNFHSIICESSIRTLKVRSSEMVTRTSLFQGQNSAEVKGPRWLVKVEITSCLWCGKKEWCVSKDKWRPMMSTKPSVRKKITHYWWRSISIRVKYNKVQYIWSQTTSRNIQDVLMCTRGNGENVHHLVPLSWEHIQSLPSMQPLVHQRNRMIGGRLHPVKSQ